MTRCQLGVCFSTDANFSANTACDGRTQCSRKFISRLFHFLYTNYFFPESVARPDPTGNHGIRCTEHLAGLTIELNKQRIENCIQHFEIRLFLRFTHRRKYIRRIFKLYISSRLDWIQCIYIYMYSDRKRILVLLLYL